METTRVVVDAKIENGNPHLAGSRQTVFDVVYSCHRDGIGNFLEENPELTTADLGSVLRYCKNRRCDRDGEHCGGCSLRTIQDGIESSADYVQQYSEVRFVDSSDVIKGGGQGVKVMPGNKEDFEKSWRGDDGWLIAGELLESI